MRVAIIPARGGSRRIPRKNVRSFHGRPIIAYSIDAAKRSGLFDRVIVTSDDADIRIIARQCGAEAIEREMKYAQDDVGTQDVTRDALVELEVAAGKPLAIEYVCCIYATAPLMRAGDIRCMFEHFSAIPRLNYSYIEGWLYWGLATAFMDGAPLDKASSTIHPPADRWIDINTEDDWKRAEQMFAAQHPVAA